MSNKLYDFEIRLGQLDMRFWDRTFPKSISLYGEQFTIQRSMFDHTAGALVLRLTRRVTEIEAAFLMSWAYTHLPSAAANALSYGSTPDSIFMYTRHAVPLTAVAEAIHFCLQCDYFCGFVHLPALVQI